jgi:hypothetical protein
LHPWALKVDFGGARLESEFEAGDALDRLSVLDMKLNGT